MDQESQAHHWYVVHVLSTHEKKAKRVLEEQRDLKGVKDDIEQVLLPIEKVSEVKGGEKRITERRIWPGYLLLKMRLNDLTWAFVNETPGVIGFLGGNSPSPLSDVEVNSLLDDLRSKQEQVTQKHQFQVGDNVKIIEGVFVNCIGTITDVSQEKGLLSVRLALFGRDTQVDDLDFSQVEEIENESQE